MISGGAAITAPGDTNPSDALFFYNSTKHLVYSISADLLMHRIDSQQA